MESIQRGGAEYKSLRGGQVQWCKSNTFAQTHSHTYIHNTYILTLALNTFFFFCFSHLLTFPSVSFCCIISFFLLSCTLYWSPPPRIHTQTIGKSVCRGMQDKVWPSVHHTIFHQIQMLKLATVTCMQKQIVRMQTTNMHSLFICF